MIKEAMFFNKLKENLVQCRLCPHNCIIYPDEYGRCNIRQNIDGSLFTLNFGEISSMSIDPIEKKPLHFYKRGRSILSVGTFGCNFKCDFCQNYTIAQIKKHQSENKNISPENLVDTIIKNKNSIGIAFTYNEPTIWYEYIFEVSKLLKKKDPNKDIVLITNGYINEKPLRALLPYIDAMNIDLKGFKDKYYQNICGGRLEPVLKTIELSAKEVHVEITTLLVTGENDDLEEVESIAKFLRDLDPDIPLHLNRYFPTYKMDSPPTDLDFMYQALDIGKKHLNKVILGNV